MPSGSSQNPSQVHSGCFALGPDLSKTGRERTANLYALFVPGATQYGCLDGTRRHDYVLAAGPGEPGYTAAWRVIRGTPGPSFDGSRMPYTTEAAVLAAAARGELVLTDTGFSFRAPIAR